jgi:hypothetical protein
MRKEGETHSKMHSYFYKHAPNAMLTDDVVLPINSEHRWPAKYIHHVPSFVSK